MKLLIKQTFPDGDALYQDETGLLHRLDGPAVEWSDGYKAWYVNGKRHRIGGPAIIWADGGKQNWIDGRNVDLEDQ